MIDGKTKPPEPGVEPPGLDDLAWTDVSKLHREALAWLDRVARSRGIDRRQALSFVISRMKEMP